MPSPDLSEAPRVGHQGSLSRFLLALCAAGCRQPPEEGSDGTAAETSSAESGEAASTGDDATCSVLLQDCDSGLKCLSTRPYARPVLVDDGAATWCTVVADPPVGLHQACSVNDGAYRVDGASFDDCGPGLLCWALDESSRGMCEPLCAGAVDTPTCPEGSTCGAGPGAGALVCVPTCDPLAQDCVNADQGCFPFSQGWGCYPRDLSSQGTTGWPCSYHFRCQAGFACLPENDFPGCPISGGHGGCCARICDRTDPEADAACIADDPQRSCREWLPEEEAVGYPDLGVCVPSR